MNTTEKGAIEIKSLDINSFTNIMTEFEFSTQVKDHLQTALKTNGYDFIKVKERVNILNSLTVGKIKDDWKVIFGFLEQDIVLYQEEIDITDIQNDKILIPRATKDKKIIIPLAVFELKIGKNINTHQFITYSHIARELKSVFPHCAYYFVSSGFDRKFAPETLLRHTKEFDRVFMDWGKDKERVLGDLLPHLEYLKRMKILRG